MKKITLFISSLLAISCANTKSTESKSASLLSTYSKTITESELKNHLYTISSDSMQGRETGSKGQKLAGQYLINQYKKDHIPPAQNASDYLQNVPASALKTRKGEVLAPSENICAFIKGSEKPDEIIVISAHYDHIGIKNGIIFNGADDDGSGTVALLEIAQAFKIAQKDGHGPKRSILFLHVTGEEHGLLGSKYYSEHPLYPIKNTVSDINIDMIGRRDVEHAKSNNYVYVIGAERLSNDLLNIVIAANEKNTQMDLDFRYTANDPNHYYERSDHYNFAKFGIPSVFFFNGVHADYHRSTDTVEKIEFDALTKRTKLAFAVAWELANRENRITIDKK
ncbi:M28 family metallopeptidase [Flavobacterium sp. 7A]|uniref:M28 family metallopeptidase n=1 Tax=Flavobacterium sp. 7A TaxID=2940571 RepID=UPI002226D72D|nr:M28 family metallopeptidase [Flavobacterium sp. 7A]MCW2120852.1 Zn-dependent M28 family amino/carboxypeptidase [Flavobacterium sp. 7A]